MCTLENIHSFSGISHGFFPFPKNKPQCLTKIPSVWQGGDANSGAQWAFNGTLYCAYNDGTGDWLKMIVCCG